MYVRKVLLSTHKVMWYDYDDGFTFANQPVPLSSLSSVGGTDSYSNRRAYSSIVGIRSTSCVIVYIIS